MVTRIILVELTIYCPSYSLPPPYPYQVAMENQGIQEQKLRELRREETLAPTMTVNATVSPESLVILEAGHNRFFYL